MEGDPAVNAGAIAFIVVMLVGLIWWVVDLYRDGDDDNRYPPGY